jgi:hypothetical protein
MVFHFLLESAWINAFASSCFCLVPWDAATGIETPASSESKTAAH